jgi:hypothetical protein
MALLIYNSIVVGNGLLTVPLFKSALSYKHIVNYFLKNFLMHNICIL